MAGRVLPTTSECRNHGRRERRGGEEEEKPRRLGERDSLSRKPPEKKKGSSGGTNGLEKSLEDEFLLGRSVAGGENSVRRFHRQGV